MTKLAKHKIRFFSKDGNFNEIFHEEVIRSVRNKVLQKFLYLFFVGWGDPSMPTNNRPLFRVLIKRCLKKGISPSDPENIANMLKPIDVMIQLGCSKRTAYEYISAFRFLVSWV